MSDSELERIAKLEAQSEDMHRRVNEIHGDVREIKKAVTSWRGMVLGVALAVSLFWTGLMGAWNFLKHKVGV